MNYSIRVEIEISTNRFAKIYMEGFLENLNDFLSFLAGMDVQAGISADTEEIYLFDAKTGERLAVLLNENLHPFA
jgi:hypothetical protein